MTPETALTIIIIVAFLVGLSVILSDPHDRDEDR
jgi:hypothetical protein